MSLRDEALKLLQDVVVPIDFTKRANSFLRKQPAEETLKNFVARTQQEWKDLDVQYPDIIELTADCNFACTSLGFYHQQLSHLPNWHEDGFINDRKIEYVRALDQLMAKVKRFEHPDEAKEIILETMKCKAKCDSDSSFAAEQLSGIEKRQSFASPFEQHFAEGSKDGDSKTIDEKDVVLKFCFHASIDGNPQQEFEVLGSQHLTKLRDSVYCVHDHLVRMENTFTVEVCASHVAEPPRDPSVWQSEGEGLHLPFFFIEGTFFVDTRVGQFCGSSTEKMIEGIRDWLRVEKNAENEHELGPPRRLPRPHSPFIFTHNSEQPHTESYPQLTQSEGGDAWTADGRVQLMLALKAGLLRPDGSASPHAPNSFPSHSLAPSAPSASASTSGGFSGDEIQSKAEWMTVVNRAMAFSAMLKKKSLGRSKGAARSMGLEPDLSLSNDRGSITSAVAQPQPSPLPVEPVTLPLPLPIEPVTLPLSLSHHSHVMDAPVAGPVESDANRHSSKRKAEDLELDYDFPGIESVLPHCTTSSSSSSSSSSTTTATTKAFPFRLRAMGLPDDCPLNVVSMQDAKFNQILMRPGVRYLYVHQGHCEHFVYLTDAHEVHAGTERRARTHAHYPRTTFRSRERRRVCEVCESSSARVVAYADRLAPKSPAFFCEYCYHLMHYTKDGNLIYDDFMVFPYLHDAN